jgi:hypothetical protein
MRRWGYNLRVPYRDLEVRKAKQKEISRRHYLKNREAKLAANKAWREAHPEKQREYSKRWLSNPENLEKQRAACRRWQANNPDWQREWDKANPEKRHAIWKRYWENGGREKQAAWNEANREAVRASQDKHRRANLSKFVDKENRRRVRMLGGEFEHVDRLTVYERDGGICHICGKRVSVKSFTLDHLIPVARGGPHVATNLRVAHKVCNSRRGTGRLPAQLLLV